MQGDAGRYQDIGQQSHRLAVQALAKRTKRTKRARWEGQALSSKSPIQLTKFGNEISRTLDFQATAKELAPKLRQRAAGKLKYDIQTLSFDFIRREYQPSREVEVRMKTYSYDEGVAMEIILDVLAVELRNQLL